MNQPNIPYVFCSDRNYLDATLVAMRSLAISNPIDLVSVLVTSEPIDERHINQFQTLSRAHGFHLTLKVAKSDLLNSLPINYHITPAAYLKILLPEILPEFDRIIYLDSDMIITNNIGKLKTINLAENLVAAAPELMPERIKTLEIQNYFNSGVLVFNAKRWRDNDTSRKIVVFSQANPEKIRFAEQCGLNKVVNGYVQPIDATYNYLLNGSQPIPRDLFDDIKVFHFNGGLKPWNDKSSRYQNQTKKRLYEYILKETIELMKF